MSKFGIAGGINATWMFPNYDEINKQLPAFGIDDELSGGLLTWGGGGYVYLLIVDDLRVGGMGFGGSQSVSSNSNGYHNEVKYGMSGGAFTVEYTLPFVKRIGISVEGMIGGGKLTVDIFKNNDDREMIHFDEKFTLIFDGEKRSRRVLSKLELNEITTYILKRK